VLLSSRSRCRFFHFLVSFLISPSYNPMFLPVLLMLSLSNSSEYALLCPHTNPSTANSMAISTRLRRLFIHLLHALRNVEYTTRLLRLQRRLCRLHRSRLLGRHLYIADAAIVSMVGLANRDACSSSPLPSGESCSATLPWIRRLAVLFSASVMFSAFFRMSGAHCGSLGVWPTDMPTRTYFMS
jgi:hypothetical protein